MLTLIDNITGAFLTALMSGWATLNTFVLPILGVCAVISFYREYSTTVMSSGAGVGDALAHGLLLIFAAGCYLFLLQQLFTIAQAALDTVFYWGLLGSGSSLTTAQLRAPSFIFETGLKAARPIADFDTWFRAAQSTIRLAAHPGDLVAYWAIILAFLGVTLHVAMMLVEFYLAVMLASVLVPWGIWRMTSGVAEFGLGWLTGALIRALVTSAMVGVATGTFDALNQAPPDAGFFTFAQTFRLLGGSFLYLILCWVIPVQASRLAGQASLGLTGSTLLAGAMTGQRFALMASSLTSSARRVISPLVNRTP
jgi:type IV secretory pathway TrbL component